MRWQATYNIVAKRLPTALEAWAITVEFDADVTTATRVIDQAVTAEPKHARNRP